MVVMEPSAPEFAAMRNSANSPPLHSPTMILSGLIRLVALTSHSIGTSSFSSSPGREVFATRFTTSPDGIRISGVSSTTMILSLESK